jgi:hypothetical protein
MQAMNRPEHAAAEIERGARGLEAMAKLDAKTLSRRYAHGKWSGFELLAHIADADVVYYYRFLKVIAEEGVPIVPYDGERWIVELHASERPAEVSLAASRGARAGFVHHLRSLPREVLDRKTVHPEEGVLSALDIATWIGEHALHHLTQLEAIREGKTWQPEK